jgi:acetoin utilization protein AcuB
VEPGDTVAQARTLLARHRIRQLPVMRTQRLVGIVTDRDLRSAAPRAKTVGDIMSRKPLVITSTASIDEAARLLRRHKIGALPVVDGTALVGILSASDILDAFVEISGVGETSYRLAIVGAKGSYAAPRVRHAIEQAHGAIHWMHADGRQPGKLHVRLKARNIDDVVVAVEALGFEVETVVAPSRARA